MKVSRAKKKATVISNDLVFLKQLCEKLITNPIYEVILVLSNSEQVLFNDKLVWRKINLIAEINNFNTKGDDVFCRIINEKKIEDYNAFTFNLAKQLLLLSYSRAYINIDLAQYLMKKSLPKILEYQKLESRLLKLPFWSMNLLITVKTRSVDKDLIDVPSILKTGSKFIGRKLLSSLGLPLIVVPSNKIAEVMNLMTNSLEAGSEIYHSDDIQKILNNEKNRN